MRRNSVWEKGLYQRAARMLGLRREVSNFYVYTDDLNKRSYFENLETKSMKTRKQVGNQRFPIK